MSNLDRVWLLLHIAFVIFTLGPLTAATMATPRHIRRGDLAVIRYLNRSTRLYGATTLGIVAFGLLMSSGRTAQAYLTASLTLFIVAIGLLLVIERDQRRSVHALARATAPPTATTTATSVREVAESAADSTERTERITETETRSEAGNERESVDQKGPPTTPAAVAEAADPARVERGRIATISGVVALIWMVILALMIWGG